MAGPADKAAAIPTDSDGATPRPNDLGFDPWQFTIERSLDLPLDLEDPHSKIRQVMVALSLTRSRQKLEVEGGKEVVYAIARCVKHGLIVPEWLARLFVPRVDSVRRMEVKSWDDAFGKAHKGKHIDQNLHRDEQLTRLELLLRRHDRKHPGTRRPSVGDLADEIGASVTAIERLLRQLRQEGRLQ